METITPSQVRALRQLLGESQVTFGARFGISQPLVALWESGDRVPNGPAAILFFQVWKRYQKKLTDYA
jgi:DNA-binding transcriptional regulator YiaG